MAHRFHELEVQHTEATTLLHLQGTLIIDLQVYHHHTRCIFHLCLLIYFLKCDLKPTKPACWGGFIQNQLHNLTLMLDQVQRNHGCFINIGHPNTLMNTQEALHSGTCFCTDTGSICRKLALRPIRVPSDVQHVRSCPIDCASIYYNGVRRSGLYTIVPSLAAMPLEVYCDMDTDGEPARPIQFGQERSCCTSSDAVKLLLHPRWRLDCDPAACRRVGEL